MKPRYIAHRGGEMPVSPDCVVEVVFKDGATWHPVKASEWGSETGGGCWWRHESEDSGENIIAYRVIEQE